MEAPCAHVKPIIPEVVTATLFAKLMGASGRTAAIIATTPESALYPNAFRA